MLTEVPRRHQGPQSGQQAVVIALSLAAGVAADRVFVGGLVDDGCLVVGVAGAGGIGAKLALRPLLPRARQGRNFPSWSRNPCPKPKGVCSEEMALVALKD